MDNERLSRAIRAKANEMYEAHEELHDEFSLLRALALIVEGRSVEEAFGAPGDWGYRTDIGQALADMPRIEPGRQEELL